MAKYECKLTGNFNEFLDLIHNGIMKGSFSATYEDGSNFQAGDIRCAVRIYERYSMIGKNRVSLNITLLGNDKDLQLSAITSGGSQAVLFKINTWGEEAFLDCLAQIVKNYNRTV
jgi:hypothetical protein